MDAHANGNQTVVCTICHKLTPWDECERAWVHCNIRKFRHERFEVWRCPGCQSIHAAQEVDLPHYYAGYPILDIPDSQRLRLIFGNMERRLRAAGLRKDHRILDYGCGSGRLLKYLISRGYTQASGYDAYSQAYVDRAALAQQYDCIITQDVIEHVDSPAEFLRELDKLAAPGALVAIGTPDALGIDLKDPDASIHALHAPYHRHILAHTVLEELARALGWDVCRYYSTMYTNTLVPAENPRFGQHYLRHNGDCLDLLIEPPRLRARWLLDPATYFFMFFGYFFDRHTDIMFTFKKPAS
jgi:2-polyprenyl-3-methyl-5-hydroxy-6-metoxy-1,4-benzoquinol methylase